MRGNRRTVAILEGLMYIVPPRTYIVRNVPPPPPEMQKQVKFFINILKTSVLLYLWSLTRVFAINIFCLPFEKIA